MHKRALRSKAVLHRVAKYLSMLACGGLLVSCTHVAKTAQPRPEATSALASWAHGYKSLEELVSAADIIVVATIVGPAIIDTDGGSEHSVSSMRVEAVLKDYKRRANIDWFSVRQTGTRVATNALGDPIFERGQRVVLFMREYRDNVGVVLSGPNGRFDLKNGQVFAAGSAQIKLPAGLSEQQFAAQVMAIAHHEDSRRLVPNELGGADVSAPRTRYSSCQAMRTPIR